VSPVQGKSLLAPGDIHLVWEEVRTKGEDAGKV